MQREVLNPDFKKKKKTERKEKNFYFSDAARPTTYCMTSYIYNTLPKLKQAKGKVATVKLLVCVFCQIIG